MQIDKITIISGWHKEKMDLEATYPNLLNAQKAINMILANSLIVFDHRYTEITFHFDDGFIGKVSFRTCAGLNGRYFVADLLDQLIEYMEDRIKGRFMHCEETLSRLKNIQEQWEQLYTTAYNDSSEHPNM